MGRKATTITLSDDDRILLEKITKTRTIQLQTAQRARILLLKAEGLSNDSIAERVDLDRKSIMFCIKKYLEGGVENALFDASGRGRNAEITDDEKAWIISIANEKPRNLGYSNLKWTMKSLTKYINNNAEYANFMRLSTISPSSVQKVLNEAGINLKNIQYCCKIQNSELDQKPHVVLLVYKQLLLKPSEDNKLLPISEDGQVVRVFSSGESLGLSAVDDSFEIIPYMDIKGFSKAYNFTQSGFRMISLFSGIDLQTGVLIPLVNYHYTRDGLEPFLDKLDSNYPKEDKIVLILDNSMMHTSKNTKKYLSTVLGRFEIVSSPKHGSWLNLVEILYNKLICQSLKSIRAYTKQELVKSIYQYFKEFNKFSIITHWTNDFNDIDPREKGKDSKESNPAYGGRRRPMTAFDVINSL